MRSLLTITFTPDRVSKPSLPVVIGIVRTRSPSRNTLAVWDCASTWVIIRGPMENVVDVFLAP